MVTIVEDNFYGDWEGLYIDGKLVTEGHRITTHDLLTHKVIDSVVEVNMQEKNIARLPESLDEC